MASQGFPQYPADEYYNSPIPAHATEPSMLFSPAEDPQHFNESFTSAIDHSAGPPHNNQIWHSHDNVLLGELDLEVRDLDVQSLYPPFLQPSSSPSPALPQASQHGVYPTSSPNHLSPHVPAIRTGNLHSPSLSGHSVGLSPSTYYPNPGMTTPSPTSPYPSSPEMLRTPGTPYLNLRNDMVGIHASSASPASSVDPRPLWPLTQAKEGRPRAYSDTRVANPIGRGPMVPQKRYRPHTTSDRRRYVEEVELEKAIAFSTLRPEMDGFALSDAIAGKFANLAHRDDQMFNDRGPSISVRINWPGYNSWSRQIPTRDFRNPPGPITRSKLAKNVAKSVARFIVEQTGKPMDEDADLAWHVGGSRGIQLNHLALVRLDHVSKGSWQAQLCLVDPSVQL